MKIKIRNTDWELMFLTDQTDDLSFYGKTSPRNRQIYIVANEPITGLKDTVAHELVHAYLYECGFRLSEDDEEMIATFIGRNFFEMQENFNKIFNDLKKIALLK